MRQINLIPEEERLKPSLLPVILFLATVLIIFYFYQLTLEQRLLQGALTKELEVVTLKVEAIEAEVKALEEINGRIDEIGKVKDTVATYKGKGWSYIYAISLLAHSIEGIDIVKAAVESPNNIFITIITPDLRRGAKLIEDIKLNFINSEVRLMQVQLSASDAYLAELLINVGEEHD
ncbi:MAG: hypothetical protein SCK28_04070 [Bacillota bacterium]|nr:hypothetical protein [Bacillota bacterium]